jgi:2-oxoisovalerate dehydrogenase E2 component (dihydrolipoyl transacylase)
MIVGDSRVVSHDNIAPQPDKPLGVDSAHSSSEASCPSGTLSTPAVRHLAKQYGFNINEIQGTGIDGRVLKEDVLNYAVSRGLCEELSSALEERIEKVELPEEGKSLLDVHCYEDKKILLRYHKSCYDVCFVVVGSMRGHTACKLNLTTYFCRGYQRAMIKSMSLAAKVPHFHFLEEINCDALVKLKASFQNENKDHSIKHTFLPFLVKSLSMTLSKYPVLNSSFIEETNEVVLKGIQCMSFLFHYNFSFNSEGLEKNYSISIWKAEVQNSPSDYCSVIMFLVNSF